MYTDSSLRPAGAASLQKSAQVDLLEHTDCGIRSFSKTLAQQGTEILRPSGIDTFQINIGWKCNLSCSHCHVDASPSRQETMTRDTMSQCLEVLKREPFRTIDITGGAPEMNPDFLWFVGEIRSIRPDSELLVRTNLTLLTEGTAYREYPKILAGHRVSLIASLPCHTQGNVDSQRGEGVFRRSIEGLRVLNAQGYGQERGELELNLVYNPSGASLPGKQSLLEQEYREHLLKEYGITFNHLYTITNMPISRFLQNLLDTGTYCDYMKLLAERFNPMLDLPVDPSAPGHIREFDRNRLLQRRIVTGQHCYGCTAGSGSSCQGCLT